MTRFSPEHVEELGQVPTETDEGSRRDPVCLVAAALTLLPCLAAMVSALRTPWVPSDDWALLELQVRAVGTTDTPLLGAWSRFGWDHPGPWPLYLLAVPYRLVPAENGLLFAAAALNLGSVAACTAMALRRSRLRALVLLVGLTLLQHGMGIRELTDPWNPLLPIIPFALYCLVCLELVVRPRPWMLAVAVAAASFVLQAHLGFGPPVALIAVTTAALARWHRPGGPTGEEPSVGADDDRPTTRRWVVAAAVVAVVAWLPVALDQVAGEGNAGRIVRWAAGDDLGVSELSRDPIGFGRAVGGAAWLTDPVGLWIGNADTPRVFGFDLLGNNHPATLLWVPLVLGAAAGLLRRTSPTSAGTALARAAAGLGGAGMVAVLGTIATARGLPVAWAFRWGAVVVMLIWVALGWAVATRLDEVTDRRPAVPGRVPRTGRLSGPRLRTAAATGLMALLVVVVTSAVGFGSLGARPVGAASRPLTRLAPAVVEHAGDDDLVVASSEEPHLSAVDLALPVVLDRAGIAWVQTSDPRAEGRSRLSIHRAEALDGLVGVLVDLGGAEVLATSGPPRDGERPDSELILLRVHPADRADLGQLEELADADEMAAFDDLVGRGEGADDSR